MSDEMEIGKRLRMSPEQVEDYIIKKAEIEGEIKKSIAVLKVLFNRLEYTYESTMKLRETSCNPYKYYTELEAINRIEKDLKSHDFKLSSMFGVALSSVHFSIGDGDPIRYEEGLTKKDVKDRPKSVMANTNVFCKYFEHYVDQELKR